MKRVIPTVIVVCVVAGGTYLATAWNYSVGPFAANSLRDVRIEHVNGGDWATPISLDGVPNLHMVNPELYRGAQPTEDGYRKLKALGIRTVVSLRDDENERDMVAKAGFKYVHVKMNAWQTPRAVQVVAALRVMSDPNAVPVFVHCRQGADRTGTMCAAYRVAVQGWDRNAAADEMTRGGFGYHKNFKPLERYIRTMDAAAIRRQAGLTSQPISQ